MSQQPCRICRQPGFAPYALCALCATHWWRAPTKEEQRWYVWRRRFVRALARQSEGPTP